MKGKIFILFSFLVIMISCNKKNDNIEANINGNYIGIFERNGNDSKVELTFNNGTFNGQSELGKFPAICRGTYTSSGNKMTFTNNCAWTAEFDWTLILRGDWNLNLNNNILIMTKSNGDKYILTRQ
jgi:hypothetical protein